MFRRLGGEKVFNDLPTGTLVSSEGMSQFGVFIDLAIRKPLLNTGLMTSES